MRERVLLSRSAPAGVTRVKPALRRRLAVGPADDRYEQEADAIADQVTATLRRAPVAGGAGGVQRPAAPGAVGRDGGDVPAETAGRIRPAGDRFDGATRARMEQAFGADF